MLRILPFLLLLATLLPTVAINHSWSSHHTSAQIEAYRTPPWLKQNLTFGYQKMLAVFYWFNIISDFGNKSVNATGYSLLAQRLDTITILNPYAGHAYYTAATVLTWQLHSTQLSGPLLERGTIMMPDEWRWPYYRGFYSYFFDHDPQTAAKYLAIATKHPDVPPILIRLTAKMRAVHGELDTAQLFLEQMLDKKQDVAIRKKLEEEIKQIHTERVLRAIDRALASIPNWQGDLQQLKQLGIRLPHTLPDGGSVIFNQQHQPISSIEKKRYKLFQSSAYRRNSQ